MCETRATKAVHSTLLRSALLSTITKRGSALLPMQAPAPIHTAPEPLNEQGRAILKRLVQHIENEITKYVCALRREQNWGGYRAFCGRNVTEANDAGQAATAAGSSLQLKVPLQALSTACAECYDVREFQARLGRVFHSEC